VVTKVYRERRLSWRQLGGLNWQAVAEDLPALPPEAVRADRGGAVSCPARMELVAGGFLVDRAGRDDTDEVMFAQNRACSLWLTADRGVNGLCNRFDRDRWQEAAAGFPRRPMRFCIDRYEYPGVHGEFPLVVATFSESEAYCAREGKRLCTESEWTFACEGEEGRPYPYGYERDQGACRIGVMGPGPDDETFKPRTTARTARGLDLAWRALRSGESPRCESPFGVMDMTGNVDEWTRTVRKYGYKMIMKGGHWGPARQRCRPQTRGHGPYYVRYDQGFRCCAEAAP
jgi:formylglycine-generating enzyme